MKLSPLKSALLGAALGGLAACTSPLELCGCTLPAPLLAAEGVVRTAAGAPVAGARVSARVMMGTCAPSTAVILPYAEQRPLTSATGAYALTFYAAHASAAQCVRVVAERAPGDTAYSDTAIVQASAASAHPTPRRLDIVFPG